MIPKAFRLKLESQHPFRGQKHLFPWGIIISAPSQDLRWSVSVSVKASPSAVVRNHLRRQISQGLYRQRHRLEPHLSFSIVVTKPGFSGNQIIDYICSIFTVS